MRKTLLTLAPFFALALPCASCSDSPNPSGTDAGTDSGISSNDGSVTPPNDGSSPKDGSSPTDDSGKPVVGDPSSVASYFASSLYFNEPIDTAPVDSQSSTIVSTWVANGGWGGPGHIQIDTSIDVYIADTGSTQMPYQDDGSGDTDKDIPATIPVSSTSSAGFESGSGKTCDGGDCHYIVLDAANHQLIEVYQADASGSKFTADGGGAYVWDLLKAYPANLRGDVCTSADASGGMIAPLLFSADEVAAGHIDHAIRFILPNTRIQYREYVRPATHGTGKATGWAMTNGVPYGARFRLKTVDTSGMTAGAKVVVAAMQKYGIILSDGGAIALTARSDKESTHKWSSTLGIQDLASLKPTDFEMVVGTYGSDQVTSEHRYDFTSYACTRVP